MLTRAAGSIAAIGTLLITLVLAGVSYWYAQLTRSSLTIRPSAQRS